MFSNIKNFIYRHKKKFIVSGIVIGGAIFLKNYTRKKFLEWQEQEAKQFLEVTRKEQHFRCTERTCNQTICSLSVTLEESIVTIIDTNDLLTKIRNGEGNRVLLWDTLKVKSFAQLSSLLYSGLMLVIVLRIQLNVIGGYMFREKMDSQCHDTFTSAFQEHYLSLCHYFLNKGVKDLCTLIENHTRVVVEPIPLKQKMSLQDIETIFWCIHASLSHDPQDPLKNLSKYLLPPLFHNVVYKDVDSDKMKLIIDDTFEILESEEVKSIADSCIKRSFSNVVDKIASTYYSLKPADVNSCKIEETTAQDYHDFKNITKMSVPLAKIIPLIHGIKGSADNELLSSWIQQFLVMDNINMLGSNLYDAFSVV